MKTSFLLALLAYAAVSLPGSGGRAVAQQPDPPAAPSSAPEAAAPTDAPEAAATPKTEADSQPETFVQSTETEIAGWGKAADPDKDCQFFVSKEALRIHVPGSTHSHDLAAERRATNAPRVLQSAKGDFTIQVQVDGGFAPGNASSLAGSQEWQYHGAGLVATPDPQNCVTLARAVLQFPQRDPAPYANFEIRVNGKLQRIGMTGDHPLPKSGPVFLRLERRGNQFLGAVSTDGVQWDALDPKDVPDTWSQETEIGVAAISSSTSDFAPQFSKLQVVK